MARNESNEIHLRSRRFTPKAGVGAGLAKTEAFRGGRKTAHVIVQPAGPVDDAMRRRLAKEAGVRLLDPVPDGAYFAAVPADQKRLQASVGRGAPLRAVVPIDPADKLDATLADPPEHARGERGVRVVVLFFGDVPVAAQRRILKPFGDALRVEPLNAWVVEVPDARELAALDEVKWVEPAPPPIELDNDGVRSATGVDADAVLAAPYGLSGAGVTVGHWEDTHASLTHPDFAGRIVLADPPVTADERTALHTESVAANGVYDVGEAIYVDLDDSATVSAGDVRITAVGAFAAGSVVAAADPDVGTALVPFAANERFADTNNDFAFSVGDAIYRDADNSGTVSVGDVRLVATGAFAAGSVVAAGDADLGRSIFTFGDPHYHSTHVAGTVIGSGANSAARGGAANQWKGVAPGATLRSYRTNSALQPDYVDAAANGTTLSTNSWGYTHMHQVLPGQTGYEVTSAMYDAVISGRRSDGTASGLAAPILVVGSSGNAGYAERHAENVAGNAAFDAGESVYSDRNDSATVSGGDVLLAGPAQVTGTALANFRADEKHTENAGSGQGVYTGTEAVYRDVDGSGTVTAGDVRLTAVGAFAAGSVVAAADSDVGQFLRPFAPWGTVRVPNSAKNTVVVANVASDTAVPSASSSRGPTLDGRVKPDVAGPGSQSSGDFAVTSTQPRARYGGLTGTSMSTPAVAGSLALVTERYRQLCNASQPAPHTLRALLIHGAQDLTTIPNFGTGYAGPDYTFGYGRARVKETVDLIPHHLVRSATALGDTDYTFTVGAMPRLAVTLAWDDPAWTANAAPSPVTGMLQNDLDLLLIAPDGTQHTPWLLNPADPTAPATRSAVPAGSPVPAAARDRRNTVEQVVVDNAAAGTWTIRVTASTLALGPQPYTLVGEMVRAEDGPCDPTPAGDVWMKDNAADTGDVSTGTMWLSPDLWNRLAADGGTTHANPEYGQVNYLYANVRNKLATTIRQASVDVWIAPASTGLAWPASFTFVGRFGVANLAPGERQVGPLAWRPPSPMPSDHFCFYVRVTSAQDPITIVETTDVGANAQASNNIVWRNVNVVDNVLPNTAVSFMVRNVDEKQADVELVVITPPDLIKTGAVHLQLPPELERRLGKVLPELVGIDPPDPFEEATFLRTLERLRRLGVRTLDAELPRPPRRRITEPEVRLPVALEPQEAHAMTLTFTTGRKRGKPYVVDVIQEVKGEAVGGIRYVVTPKKG
jgi:hypothetical protein